MNRYNKLYEQFSGIALIVAPLLLTVAAIVATLGIGSNTGRWYDSWLEGLIMLVGAAFFVIALLALSKIIGQRYPTLGIITAVMGVVGGVGVTIPYSTRILGAGLLIVDTPIDKLDLMFGGVPDTIPPMGEVISLPILIYFLNLLLLAFGLWRVKEIPRYSPLLLVAGVILLMVAQIPFEVNHPAYLASTISWLIALPPIGWRILTGDQATLTFASVGHNA